jgi:hypothetical protein
LREQQFYEECYRPVRDSLKRGVLNNFTRDELTEIDVLVKNLLKSGASDVGPNHRFPNTQLQGKFLKLQFHLSKSLDQLKKEQAPVLYKALSISFDFRDYLGVLSLKEKDLLRRNSEELLTEIRKRKNLSDERQRELLKEQIRLLCVYANQCYRESDFRRAQRIINTLKETIDEKLKAKNKCRTVLGSIYYLEGKLLRNTGQYPACEKSLSDSIESYTDWTRDNNSLEDLTLSSYKNAMSLGGIAWCKNMRGFSRDALTLINAARLLVLPTEWELDKAHLDLIYADISRTFASEKSVELKDAIAIAQHSYKVFDHHPHERLRSRAAFTLALLHYYAGDYQTSEDFLKIVEAFSIEKKEARWHANALILLARIRNKQKRFRDALNKLLPEAIDKAEADGLDDRVVVAYIVKSESHLGLNQRREAVEALTKAQNINDRRSGRDNAVNSERNKGWIFLYFALAYLQDGDLATSKLYLDKWYDLEGIKYQWLNDFAEDIRREHASAFPIDFVIKKDTDTLDWEVNKNKLACWLIEMAKRRTNSAKNTILAKELGLSTRTLGEFRKACEKRVKKTASG